MEQWRIASASVIGTSHVKQDTPCQDASECRVIKSVDAVPVLISVVSDGAGSAKRAEVGSHLVCAGIVEYIVRLYEKNGSTNDINHAMVESWIVGLCDTLANQANTEGLTIRDYACTLVVAIIDIEREVFIQIGDGAIVVAPRSEPDTYNWVFWPERGEYANQTHFITDDNVIDHMQLDASNTGIDELAVFSDGIQALALHYESQTAYAPLFRSLFVPVRHELPGISEKLSKALAAFLDSAQVNSRTDDDKTLVVSTRRSNTLLQTNA